MGVATIQIRDISEDDYEVIRRRARAAGQSIQAYMKKRVEQMVSEPDEAELFSDLERFVEAHGIRLEVEALLADLDSARR